MFKIIGKQNLSATLRRMDILCEDIVSVFRPGHFIAIATDEVSSYFPLRVFDVDERRKSLSVVLEDNTPMMQHFGGLKINDSVFVVRGPFGYPLPMVKRGTIVCVGEKQGLMSMASLCRSLKQVGNKVIGVVAFESRKNLFFENQIRIHCSTLQSVYQNHLQFTQGVLTAPFRQILEKEDVSCVYIDASMSAVQEIVDICLQKNIPVFYSIFDYIEAQPVFHEKIFLPVGEKEYFPVVQGLFVDAKDMAPKWVASQIAQMKGHQECHKKKIESLHQKSVWIRLKKFIWG